MPDLGTREMDAERIAVSFEAIDASLRLLVETAPLVQPPYGCRLTEHITSEEAEASEISSPP